MNLIMIRPENEVEYFLFSITKNCKTLIEQTDRKADGTLEFKLNKTRETFRFNQPISIEGSWLIGLTSVEVYNSFLNITEQKKNFFKFYTDIFDYFTFMELKYELEEICDSKDITPEHLQDGKAGPLVSKFYKKKNQKSQALTFILYY